MGETETYTINDLTRSIRKTKAEIEDFTEFSKENNNSKCDFRIAAMLNTKLQEAEMLSLLLIK